MANKIENRYCVKNKQFASYKEPYNTNFAWNDDRFMQRYLKLKFQNMLWDSDVAHNLSQGWHKVT